jgi:predicted MFS family arabinose efflux permease
VGGMKVRDQAIAGDEPARPASSAIPGYAWVILFVVILASVAAPLNQFKVPPLLPVLIEAFRLDLSQAGALMSIFSFTGLILALPAGLILQRLGPKATGLIAVACLVIGSGWGALAGGVGLLLATRVIEGVGMALIAVVAPASIALWFPPHSRGTPMGLWATWVPLGSVIMYNLAPTLGTSVGWQAVWWTGAAFSLLAFVLYWLFMRLPPTAAAERRAAQDARGDPGDGKPPSLATALANRDIWLLALQFACFNVAFIGFATFFPTFLAEERAYSLAQAAFITSLSTLVALGGAPLAGWLSDRLGSRRWFIAPPFLIVAAMMVLPFHLTGWPLYALMALLGLVSVATPTATFAAAPEVMGDPRAAGLGLAVISLGMNLGIVIGPLFFGMFVETMGWAVAGYWLIPVCLLGFLSGWLVNVR